MNKKIREKSFQPIRNRVSRVDGPVAHISPQVKIKEKFY
jgi:hypothetical protein